MAPWAAPGTEVGIQIDMDRCRNVPGVVCLATRTRATQVPARVDHDDAGLGDAPCELFRRDERHDGSIHGGETCAMSQDQPSRRVLFVCQHGAFRSRIAAAFFNAAPPAGWVAESAGATPQSQPSDRLRPLVAGTPAEAFADHDPPRPVAVVSAERTIAIDTELPGAESWQTAVAEPLTDERLRDEIARRVEKLVAELSASSAL
jgi:hypothetical protein